MRARRIRNRVLVAVLLLCLAGGAAALVSYVSYLPRFNVQSVAVSGAEHVAPQTIAAFADSLIHARGRSFLSRSNIFLYRPAQVARAIEARYPRIIKATVYRPSLLATTVDISVAERTPFARWCGMAASTSVPLYAGTSSITWSNAVAQSGHCYEMDKTGFVFSPDVDASSTLATSYVFTGALSGPASSSAAIGSTFAPGHFSGISAFLQYLSSDGLTPEGVDMLGGIDFAVPLAQGFYLKASLGENAETLAQNLQLVLSSSELAGQQGRLEYVDLRFGDRVYYKFK